MQADSPNLCLINDVVVSSLNAVRMEPITTERRAQELLQLTPM
jgi:hypothetical protein